MALEWAKAESQSGRRWSKVTESSLGLNPQVAQGGPELLRQVAFADRSKQRAGATDLLIFCLSLQSTGMQWTLHGSKFTLNPFWPISFRRLHCTADSLGQGRAPKVAEMGSLEKQKSTHKHFQIQIYGVLEISEVPIGTSKVLKKLPLTKRGTRTDLVHWSITEGRLGHPGMSSQLPSGLLLVRPSSDSSQQHKAKQVR